ncbi:trypsin-like peptidase domain-containing protein [Pseudopelagicola sp. nBUS_19]|uniref:trypsin-like peptidase domain-containing protein n=1 Tax=Pseudopelagicola sp. nBUS_19 TaxID=3395316 RepID=UPI003EB8F535
MFRLLSYLGLTATALLFSVTASAALPECPTSGIFHNCFGSWTHESGYKYVGEWKNDLQDGHGTATWPSGDKYVGGFKDGKKSGQGAETFANGDKYVGEYVDGRRNGYFEVSYAVGSQFFGEFKDGENNGQGIEIYANGNQYVGEYKDGKRNGYFEVIYADGKKFFGGYRNDKKNESGVLIFADGDRYIGEYKDDKWNGQGFYVFQSGSADFCLYHDDKDTKKCSGSNVFDVAPILLEEFRKLSKHQREEIQSSLNLVDLFSSKIDGDWGHDTFVGLASYAAIYLKIVNINSPSAANTLFSTIVGTKSHDADNCPADQSVLWDNCFGSYTYGTNSKWAGDKYFGEWKDNQPDGQGTYIYSDGAKYTGQYRGGKRHGQGTYKYADGAKYVGKYIEGKRNGRGVYDYADGAKYVGDWKNNQQSGHGTYIFGPDSKWAGDKYIGEFENDVFNGKGTYVHADGTAEEGIWKNGEFLNNRTSPDAVETRDPNETLLVSTGTGFFVSEKGHIITNHHVIDGCIDMKVHTEGRDLTALRIADDKQNDLALLKISETPAYVFALSNESPFPLQEISVAGFPFGDSYSSTLKFTKGVVSSLAGIGDNYSEIQIDAALQQGNSGGPIIDEYGNVVAVAVAKLDAKYMFDNFGVIPENTNFGIKASAVRNFLEGNQILLKRPNKDYISKRNISRFATSGTVYLSCWMTDKK